MTPGLQPVKGSGLLLLIGIVVLLSGVFFSIIRLIPQTEKVVNKSVAQRPSPEIPILVHDLTRKGFGDFKIEFFKDQWVGVNLPGGIEFLLDPDAMCNVVFVDNTSFIDGPGLQLNYGNSVYRSIFRIKGIDSGGKLRITIKPKMR